MRDQAREISELRGQVDDLRGMLAAMQDALATEICAISNLTRTERTILGLLSRRRSVTKDQVYTVLYATRSDVGPGEKIIDVFMCRLRPKLMKYGIEIKTLWGVGYKMPDTSRCRLHALDEKARTDAMASHKNGVNRTKA